MVKHNQTIRRQRPTNCFSLFDHIVGSALIGLRTLQNIYDLTFSENKAVTPLNASVALI